VSPRADLLEVTERVFAQAIHPDAAEPDKGPKALQDPHGCGFRGPHAARDRFPRSVVYRRADVEPPKP